MWTEVERQFEAHRPRGQFHRHVNGTFITTTGEDEQGTFIRSFPLFTSIDGLSPSGLDYKALGGSCHPVTVEFVAQRLLNE